MNNNSFFIGVIVPVFNESKNLSKLIFELDFVFSEMNDIRTNYIFINDGSTDSTLSNLKELSHSRLDIKVIDFSRNFGKEIALSAGINESSAYDAVICLDADLQHPPQLIPEMIGKWLFGAEIVCAVRDQQENQKLLRKIGSIIYYKIFNSISYTKLVPNSTDFRLYDKKVIKEFMKITERERMFRGIMDWMGFNTIYVHFVAPDRHLGVEAYSYKKLFKLAIHSITSFSLWPLRITGYLGVIISGFSFLTLLWMTFDRIFSLGGHFTSLAFVVVLNTLLAGVVLMSIGLVALYIGTIHTEVINRPLYIVRDKINF